MIPDLFSHTDLRVLSRARGDISMPIPQHVQSVIDWRIVASPVEKMIEAVADVFGKKSKPSYVPGWSVSPDAKRLFYGRECCAAFVAKVSAECIRDNSFRFEGEPYKCPGCLSTYQPYWRRDAE